MCKFCTIFINLNWVGVAKKYESPIEIAQSHFGTSRKIKIMPKIKVAFVLIDGVGDVSIPSLEFKTPLEASYTPIIDAIAGIHHFYSNQSISPPLPPLVNPPPPSFSFSTVTQLLDTMDL